MYEVNFQVLTAKNTKMTSTNVAASIIWAMIGS
jgi:hypothetical protein